jgi:hypothetical protein
MESRQIYSQSCFITFILEKVAQRICASSIFCPTLPEENNRPMGENSPNLVTLVFTYMGCCVVKVSIKEGSSIGLWKTPKAEILAETSDVNYSYLFSCGKRIFHRRIPRKIAGKKQLKTIKSIKIDKNRGKKRSRFQIIAYP